MISFSCAAEKTFAEVSSMKGVTSIYIGPMMLKMAGSGIDLGNGQDAVDLGKLTKGLSSIEIVQCDDDMTEKVKKICSKTLSKYPFEIITEINEDNQMVEISGVMNKDGKSMNMLLITVTESDELVYILMKGKIDIDTLNEAISLN